MWCSHCQQDVPAVARATSGPLVCSRCELELAVPACADQLADTGIGLESYDVPCDLAPPIDILEKEQTRQRLRRIGRQLRASYRADAGLGTLSAVVPPPAPNEPQLRAIAGRSARDAASHSARTSASWLISLLVMGGVVGFFGGVGLLAWSAAFELAQLWQWAMATTIAGEGTLIVGLAWMATRLWRNSRRVNRQLAGVDQQLNEIQRLAGSLAGSHMSCSSAYYDHFSRGASSEMLVANLRGQVDQLAHRIAAER